MFSCSPLDLEKNKMKKASHSDTRKKKTASEEFTYQVIWGNLNKMKPNRN